MGKRIAEGDIERIKREVDLVALVQSKGIELTKHGSKDLKALSPFSDEKTPSFIITPEKNVWHCMSSGKGGSVIDFVMHHEGVSFFHAYHILDSGEKSVLLNSKEKRKQSRPRKLTCPLELEAEDHQLMLQVVDYYHQRLLKSPEAREYLKKRGIFDQRALETFKIGLSDRTLGLRLPYKQCKEGLEVRNRLEKLGIYRNTGHEHFNGCVVFPVTSGSNGSTQIGEIYGRKLLKSQSTKIHHLYLPGPHSGIFNKHGLLPGGDVILTESIIDALTFWVNGIKNVTCIYGTEGFTDELEQTLIELKTQRVYLAYDRDAAGDRAAKRDAQRLFSLGMECLRVNFPHGMDANSYSLKVTPAQKSLKLLLNSAEWLGKGTALHPTTDAMHPSKKEPVAPLSPSRALSSLNPLAANKGEALDLQLPSASETQSIKEATKKKASQMPSLEPIIDGEDITFDLGERNYRVRGLNKNTSSEALKINLRLMCNGLFHIDALDLYQSKQRRIYIEEAARETRLEPELIKRDLGKLLLKLEQIRDRTAVSHQEPEEEISPEKKAEALAYLKEPKLVERIRDAFDQCGLVGEDTNKLVAYLACVSRKLDQPLAVIIQSTSAAGKTTLMEAVLNMMPEEERIKYSAMTGQSLYYLGESNLKHKILAIVEEEGAEKASYALKLLQSEGELTIASTGKDATTGRMKTEEYRVEGPVMIFLTTTAIDIDEELLNRCLILTVDESREQTERIHALQRKSRTREGLIAKHKKRQMRALMRNVQRLIKPFDIFNPFADQLTFTSQSTRTRRDNEKYLTLIDSITLLHQHQRELAEIEVDGVKSKQITTTIEDIELANQLAPEVLGRSLDELPPQTRRLWSLIGELVEKRAKEEKEAPRHLYFNRRQLREHCGWSEYQIRVHLQKLEDMEYVCRRMGKQGSLCLYQLLMEPSNGQASWPIGLIDPQKLKLR